MDQNAAIEAYKKWENVKHILDLPSDIQKKIERDEALTEMEVERVLSSPDKDKLYAQVFGMVDGELRDRMREALERLNALRNG